jgi:geranyl-CoA carboxylase alpha subunit
MFHRILIANRGEIAVRIAHSARAMGLESIAVYSDADRGAPHIAACDRAVPIGGGTPAESYLDVGKLIDAARRGGAQAVHPGYGFLSERADFARAALEAGLVFIGPPAHVIEAMGDKARARRAMAAAGVPVLPGYDEEDQSDAALQAAAQRIGFPVMVKAAAGGGGRGMRLVRTTAELAGALAAARSEAGKAFGDARLILERALLAPRHIEVQVFGDTHGNLVHIGERDCSIQRRHQKLIEEAPAPGLTADQRARVHAAALSVARSVGYVGAGTVEFLFDGSAFYFMEMNTRLQVEHPVTEAVSGLDLVEWQVRVARGEALPRAQSEIFFAGHAIEARLCAEDAAHDFLPQSGRIEHWKLPGRVRVDHALSEGLTLSPFYDSMLAKIIAHGTTREAARARLHGALREAVLLGVPTNRAFLVRALAHPAFADARLSTAFIDEHFAAPQSRAPALDDATWALAAWLSVEPAVSLPAPWAGFSSGGDTDVPARLSHGGRTREARVRRARVGSVSVVLDGVEHAVRTQAQPVWRRCGDGVHLQRGEDDWLFRDCRLAARHAAAAHGGDGRVVAPMNGRVAALPARVGAAVARGDTLVVLEAMKMEHALPAPSPGVVSAVHVGLNDQVGPGRLLVEVAPGPLAGATA